MVENLANHQSQSRLSNPNSASAAEVGKEKPILYIPI